MLTTRIIVALVLVVVLSGLWGGPASADGVDFVNLWFSSSSFLNSVFMGFAAARSAAPAAEGSR